MSIPVTEGFIPFRGFRTWYQIHGDLNAVAPGKLPILMLHGGPGAPHDYLDNLAGFAATGRPVIFYDQLGCGNSDLPDDPDMWEVATFLEELDVVRGALGLDRVHLLGQSWGGMLGMEYALTQPMGIESLTIASSPASMILWVEEANRLREALPAGINETLLKHETAGTYDDPEYLQAMQAFYDRHVCRVVPNPDYVQNAFAKLGQQVYMTMNGPSEFHVIGKLKNWDIRHRLGEITIPSLLTSGRYDELTPMQAQIVHEGIPGNEWVLFEESSHMPHVEEQDRYYQVLDHFLTGIETDRVA
ncbi:proline iminopeptidase-family hydrolase [soil metagenome]